MKKVFAMLLIMLLALSLAACAETVGMPTLGIRMDMTQEMTDAGIVYYEEGLKSDSQYGSLDFVCFNAPEIEAANLQMQAGEIEQEAFADIYEANNAWLGSVLVMSVRNAKDIFGERSVEDGLRGFYPGAEVAVTEQNGWNFCRIDMTNAIDRSALSDGMNAKLDEALPLFTQLFEGLEFVEVVPEKLFPNGMKFSTVDINGNEVTDAIFAEKDITVLNVFATWCGPCQSEMPELGQWMQEMPENAQLLFVCGDADSPDNELAISEAKRIADNAGIPESSILCMKADAFEDLDKALEVYPTTYFIRSDGTVVEEEIIRGVNTARYRSTLEELLSQK